MVIDENKIKNHIEIVEYLNNKKDDLEWESRYKGDYQFRSAFGSSKFSSLIDTNIPPDLKSLLLEYIEQDTIDKMKFIQVQKYEPGDYILPHIDNYLFIRLFTLTTSDYNGLTLQTSADGGYIFIPDRGGQEIQVKRNMYHWVDPVRFETRYTFVVGR